MRPIALYLCVHDRQRAEAFYKRLFGSASVMANASFVFFDLGGFIFGLFAPDHEYERKQFCHQNAPQLRVQMADVRSEYKKICAMTVKIIQPLQNSSEVEWFQFLDTEGNTVEFYQSSVPKYLS